MYRQLKKVLPFFWKIFLFISDGCLIFGVKIKCNNNRQLLLIRIDAIGDFILWLDAARQYRKIYPDYKIVLIANQVWAALAKKMPFWDKVWSIDRRRFLRNPLYRWHIIFKLCRVPFDAAIQHTHSREFIYGDALMRASCATERVGSVGDLSNLTLWEKRISDRWYTRLIKSDSRPMMELKRNAEFLRKLGLTNFKAGLPNLELSNIVTPEMVHKQPYYIMFPGADWAGRRWPLEFFAEISERIHSKTGYLGLICGGPGEEVLGEKIISLANVPLQNEIGKFLLIEFASVVRNAKFLVGNETSAIHIAAAVKTPSVCILGGGHFGRFMPYELEIDTDGPLPVPVYQKMTCFNCNWNCIYPIKKGEAVPCIKKISVDSVWSSVQEILSETNYKMDKTAKIS